MTTTTEAGVAKTLSAEAAREVLAHARSHPEAVSTGSSDLKLAREQLKSSLAALRSGDRAAASRLALTAYLDNFEPTEAMLGTRASSN